MGMCSYCSSGVFRWVKQQEVYHTNGVLTVNVFLCDNRNCRAVYVADKYSTNPNRNKQVDGITDRVKKQPKYVPTVEENTYDESVFFGDMYINSKGKLGVKPNGYVSTKPFTLGGKTYPPIRKARVFSRGKKK